MSNLDHLEFVTESGDRLIVSFRDDNALVLLIDAGDQGNSEMVIHEEFVRRLSPWLAAKLAEKEEVR